MSVLIGSTGFVGSHLSRQHSFKYQVHRTDVESIIGLETDLLVCAGLPAEKWRANSDPESDWSNMVHLSQVLTSLRAERAILIATIDVNQPAIEVDETSSANFDGNEAYGMHRAWFEVLFKSCFTNTLIIRLPGLFAKDVRKNLVHDLLNNRLDQLSNVNQNSMFQFFDVTQTWEIINQASSKGIELLNITSEPISAKQIADLFNISLEGSSPSVSYNMKSIHANEFGGSNGYLFNQTSILGGIQAIHEDLVK